MNLEQRLAEFAAKAARVKEQVAKQPEYQPHVNPPEPFDKTQYTGSSFYGMQRVAHGPHRKL